jgi:hypothetical protein
MRSSTGQATITAVANVPRQPGRADNGDRFLRGPTVTYRVLFVLVILAHDRRRIVHVAVTDHPTAAWTAQQLRNAFPENRAPGYLLHDRDTVFTDVASTIRAMQIHEVVTAPRSPWQKGYASYCTSLL